MKRTLRVLLVGLCVTLPALAAGGGEDHGYDWMEFAAKCVNFVIFFGILFALIKKPLREFFVNRVAGIKQSLERAETSRAEAKARLDEIEAKMSELDKELAAIEKQAREDAEREKQRIQNQARQDAERIMAQAREEIENMRREAIAALKAQVADLAVEAAEGRIKNKLNGDVHKKLFADFTEKMGAGS